MMDNIRWNVQAVLRTMHEAQVMGLFLPNIGRALIIDLRCNELEGPVIAVDGIMAGAQECIDSLKRVRPGFESPENLTLAPWLGPVRGLDETGALADLAARLDLLGRPEAKGALDRAYAELLEVERGEIMSLIRGDVQRTRTLYQR